MKKIIILLFTLIPLFAYSQQIASDTLTFECLCVVRVEGCLGDCDRLKIEKKRAFWVKKPFDYYLHWIDNVKGCYKLQSIENKD